mmetsp:Transcript_26019/g.23039  ORF Transcript_26019/g.23039 Transcript_26019/m.23039 type:complete len:81 (+) Transcript_26019:798-1040(+)
MFNSEENIYALLHCSLNDRIFMYKKEFNNTVSYEIVSNQPYSIFIGLSKVYFTVKDSSISHSFWNTSIDSINAITDITLL